MQTRSRSRAAATSCPLQSIAALLPEEILDSIFTQLGFDFPLDANWMDRVERHKNFSDMSVVAEGWTWPARRLLVKSVKVRTSWARLEETVPGWAGKQVRELQITALYWEGQTSEGAASAVFKLLKQLPNLRQIRLIGLRFASFTPTDSLAMKTAVVLPHLRDLSMSRCPAAPAVILDLLLTSNHRISRLSVESSLARHAPPLAHKKLDFRGNLRFLSTGTDFYDTVVDPRWNALEGMKGLEELQVYGNASGSREGGEVELYRVIAPTLSKLLVDSGDFAWFKRFLPLLFRLFRLSISDAFSDDDFPDPAPLLRCLPPSLCSLRLSDDFRINPTLAHWNATRSLVPAGLKHIQIDAIYLHETYQQLPLIQTLSTNYQSDTLESLGRLAPSTLPFKTLEMFFLDAELGRRSLVEVECARLRVVFRQRLEHWDA